MIKVAIGAVGLVIIVCLGLPMVLLSTVIGTDPGQCAVTGRPAASSTQQPSGAASWDTEQLSIAETIIEVGRIKGVPRWGWTIALAVAMQESGLRNLPHLGERNDRDSIGVFQQRPSQGWGTPEQLAQPAYQAGKFYEKLLAIPGWEAMPLTRAAQAVQVSAYPDAYAKWTDEALRLVELESGDAVLDCWDGASAIAVPAPRNPDGSWPHENCSIVPDPTTGAGCLTPRTLHLVQQATAAGFPDPRCFRVDDHGEHPKGQACDWMMTAGGEATGGQKEMGDAMAAWAVTNAGALGIRYVIWFRMIWTDDGRGWHAYNNPWGGDDASGWHTNHVHISVE
ncbi:hypothetical protein OHA21_00215 [Actinoplanes sp. NBC_00393]|uniref:hypothetical protein n=1 Tax=Actinoplanes sp. NBC_00393 TaxID=2975953 RepID=UPI002E1D8BFC